MTTFKTIEITGPEAQRLADLHGIQGDLRWVSAICDRLAEEERKGSDREVIEALTIAVIIRYARCFSDAVRRRIPNEWLDELANGKRQAHDYFINQRNKFFAHSVNEFELLQITAAVPEPVPLGYRIDGVGFSVQTLSSLGEPDVRLLQSLCRYFDEKLSVAIEAERPAVLEVARQIPAEGLESAELIAATHPSPRRAGKPRRNHR